MPRFKSPSAFRQPQMPHRLCLVSAPVATEYRDGVETSSEDVRANATEPPLGILSLASVLESAGRAAAVCNLDTLYLDFTDKPHERRAGAFVLHAAALL